MHLPRWDDPIASACEEAAVAMGRGLQVRPTLYGFEDGEPTLRVQVGRPAASSMELVSGMLVALVPVLGIRQVLLFTQVRCRDETIGDPDVRDALATFGVDIEVAERVGDRPGHRVDDDVTHAAYLLDREPTDGEVRWRQPLPHAGMWRDTLHHVLREEGGALDDAVGNLEPFGFAYALSRSGVAVEVAPGWRERYGFTRLPRGGERLVRPEDRRRAKDLARPRGSAGTRPAEGART